MTARSLDDDARYDVFIARYGTRMTSRSEVFLNYSLYHEPDAEIRMDYFFWVLRNDQRTIVVDTGFSPDGGRSRGRTQLAGVPELLDALQVDARAAPTVLLTHAHYDHAGNLGLFRQSKIVVSAAELDFWRGENAGKMLFHHSLDEEALTELARAESDGRLQQFRGTTQIAPGVELREVGGHTPGQAVVKVDTREGVTLLASDAVHYYEELARDMPFSSVADLVSMYDAFGMIRKMVESGEVQSVISGHDPTTFDRFSERCATDSYSELLATTGGCQ